MKCCCEPRKLSQRINELILHYSALDSDSWRSSRHPRLPPPPASSRRFRPLLSSTRRSPERSALGNVSVSGRASQASSRSPSPPLPLGPPVASSTVKPSCACSRSSSGSRSSRASSLTSIPPSSKRLSSVRLPTASAFCLREPLLSAIRARAVGSRTCTVCGSPACRKRRRVSFTPPPSCCCARKSPLRLASSMADASACRPRITRPALATLGGPGGRPWDSVSARPDLTYRATSPGATYVRPTWARRYSRPSQTPDPSCNCPDCNMDSTGTSRTH